MSMTDITISPGSVVDFSWTGVHNVVLCADEASYDACSCSDEVAAVAPNGAYAWDSAGTTGTAYFICSVGNHCVQGQKIAITVKSEAASSPPPAGAAKCSDTCVTAYEGCVGASGNEVQCRAQMGAGPLSSCTPGCTITAVSPPPAAAASGPCADTEDAAYCSKKVEKGTCSKFLDVCAASCGGCASSGASSPPPATVSEDCVDTESAAYCSKKVDKGTCSKFLDVCAVSCGACTPADAASSPPPLGSCVDEKGTKKCEKKAEKWCKKDNKAKLCAATCGLCEVVCADVETEKKCSKYLSKGQCSKKKKAEACPLTCGSCTP